MVRARHRTASSISRRNVCSRLPRLQPLYECTYTCYNYGHSVRTLSQRLGVCLRCGSTCRSVRMCRVVSTPLCSLPGLVRDLEYGGARDLDEGTESGSRSRLRPACPLAIGGLLWSVDEAVGMGVPS